MIQRRLQLIKPKTGIVIPKGYKRVSHLESVDGAYIDLNLPHQDYPSFKGSFCTTENTPDAFYVFGFKYSSTSQCYLAATTTEDGYSSMVAHYGSNNATFSTLRDIWHTFEVGYGYAAIDGVRKNFVGGWKASTKTYSLFGYTTSALNVVKSYPLAMGDFQAFTGVDNPTIARDLICCVRESDGVTGMYDLCGSICPLTNSPFYINAGEGNFLTDGVSSVTGLPSEYQQVEYIESTGTQYIDTNFKLKTTSQAELSFEITGYSTGIAGYFGSHETYLMYSLYSSGAILRGSFCGWVSSSEYANLTEIELNKRYNISMKMNEIVLNDSVYSISASNRTNATTTALIFGRNVTSAKGQMKLYACKIYNNGELVRDFIPCYSKSDSVGGLYDLCGSICPLTGTPFYMNAGTGDFERGDDV